MAAAVAVISKENYPLYVKTSSPGNDLKFLYTIHTSLDVIEEKVLTVNKTASDLRNFILVCCILQKTIKCKLNFPFKF
ncbi:trafficking protein particle complex subunit 2-like protein [Trichonephila clavata]|uniref:Trafficking protein particle complex subunit 2-like protein n=1 Tax=Trichonephila clavata TaxID=2740835 RepID=A0A8X6HG84_TRICU|nr:trafficking protein particle complex subunit 2-like protein [Trichonephila clavata]